MSKVEEKAVELLDKLDSLATQYTPEVIDGATSAVTVTAIGELIWGVIGLLSAYLIFRAGKSLTAFLVKKKEEDGYWSMWEIGFGMSSGITIFACTILTLTSVFGLFNIWNWVAIYNPELALAHRILGL